MSNLTPPPAPPDEAQRLQALQEYAILDTPDEEAFDDLTRLAAQICGTSVAMIGFLDAKQHWIKSRIGFNTRVIPRTHALSAHAILQPDLFVVEDITANPLFRDFPLAAPPLNLRFYAGMPLRTPQGGHAIGTLCVLDRLPRRLGPEQIAALRILGHQVITHLELRRHFRELESSVASHLRTEEALRLAEAKYRDIFDHVMEGIFQSTPEGAYLSVNPMLARIYGYDHPEELREAVSDIKRQVYVRPGRRDEFVRQIQQDGVVQRFESQVYRKDGSTIWISESARAVRDNDGHLLYYEGTVEDITQRKRAEEALRESELLYHSLVESLPQNIFRKDLQGRFTFANSQFCKAIGRALEDVVGLTDYDLFPAELAAKYQADDRRVVETRLPFETVEAHQPHEGETLYVQVVKTPLIDAANKVVGVQGMFWDVTERKRMEEALAYERELLRALLDNVPDAIYFKDRQSRFLRLGRAQANAFGLHHPAEALGKSDSDYFSPEHAQAAYEDEQWIIRTGQPIIGKPERETWPGRPDTWVLTTKMPLRNPAGDIIGTFGISKDITTLKAAEEELARARDSALESARVKAEFLANMSHEIRTPMNCIIGMTGLLQDTALTDEQRDFAETIRRSADSLLTLINDILDFSKFEAGKLTLEHIEFDLLETVETTVELLAERAENKGLELVSWVREDVPRIVRGDPGRLRQVLTNLLGNAIKFTDTGEVVLRLSRLEETTDATVVRFEVSDTGIGVAADVRDRLFQAFSQGDGSLTRKYGGTGLGLAISKELVELMGGHIGLASAPGAGSTFWFTLHLARQPQRTPPPPSPNPLAQLRVLIVDDHPTTCQVVHELTTAWSMRPHIVHQASRALQSLAEAATNGDPFPLALLDLQLQDVDGLDLAQQIRADPALAGTRLIMLTTMDLHLDREAWQGVGVDGYLVKPVRQSRLRDTLVRAIGHAPGSAPAPIEPSPTAPLRLRVLLAEDNVVNQKIALRQLKKLGCTADAVANGMEAIDAVRRIPYDVVLMDCQMPELDGYDATRRIRRMEAELAATGQTPVHIIAMTANALRGDREVCLAAGMNDYVSKPVKLPELQAALNRARLQPPESSPRPPQPAVEEPAIDPSIFAGLRALQEPGEPDAVAELAGLFLRDTPPRIGAIRAATEQGDAAALRAAAHSLKGSASNLGARRLAVTCARLDALAKQNDLAAAAPLLASLEAEYQRVCFLLEQETKSQKSVA